MREGGESLGVRVAEDDEERHGRQGEAKRIEHRGGGDQRGRGGHHEHPDLASREGASGQLAPGRAWVARIEALIRQAVEPHRGAARPDHRHQDPRDLPPGDAGARGDHGGGEREGQREDRVGEPDHPAVEADPTEQRAHDSTRRARAGGTAPPRRGGGSERSSCAFWGNYRSGR